MCRWYYLTTHLMWDISKSAHLPDMPIITIFVSNQTTMKLKSAILFLLFAFTALPLCRAEKVKLNNGNLSALKGTTRFNLQFDYSHMRVGNFATADEYLNKKRTDYNAKEPGKGDDFVRAWEADRRNRFEPQFIELFEKYSDVEAGEYPDAKYTIIFKTTFTEPGYNIYISRKNAEIDGQAWIVETANPTNVIAKIDVLNCAGRSFGGGDYDSGTRVQESYAMAGKALGKFLKKEL